MTKADKLSRFRIAVLRGLALGAALLFIYVISAVVATVLFKRSTLSMSSPAFRVIVQVYDPFFAALEYIPGAADNFIRLTSWLAGVDP